MRLKKITTIAMLTLTLNVFAGATDDMFDAIIKHNTEKLKSAIANKADLNALDKNGSPALNSAVIWADLTKIMVDAGANVNNAGKSDMTPLMMATMMSIPESMKLLLDAGADPKFAMKNGMTILHYATWRSNCAECVQLLVDKGVDVNAKDKNGETPITIMMTASTAKSRAETVIYTTNAYKAAGITTMPDKYMNPKESDWSNPDELIEILIKAKADVNASNAVGTTPLITAAFFNKAPLMKTLIDAGADVNQADKMGVTPIMQAAARGSKDAIEVLLNAGVDINKTFKWYDVKMQADLKDFTLLAMAASQKNVELVKYLIERGAKCTITTHGIFPVATPNGPCTAQVKNKYPINYATETGDIDVVKAIVEGCNLSKVSFTWNEFETKPFGKGTGCFGGGKFVRASDYAKKLGQTAIYNYLKENKL
jgi:ankyrin repeat protein